MVEKSAQALADAMSEQMISLKALEEMAELSEILLKSLTKREAMRPPIAKVIEEGGDVLYRLKVLFKSLDIEKQIEKRVQEKAEIMNRWLKEQKPEY